MLEPAGGGGGAEEGGDVTRMHPRRQRKRRGDGSQRKGRGYCLHFSDVMLGASERWESRGLIQVQIPARLLPRWVTLDVEPHLSLP